MTSPATPPRRPEGHAARAGLRLPPALVRPGIRQLGPAGVLDPALAWEVQRRRFDQVMRATPVPRGTSVAGQVLGGVHAEEVTAGGVRPERTVVHFHGGGYCLGTARMMRTWAAHLSAQAGCRVVVPEYRLAPARPFPAGLDDAHAGAERRCSTESGPGLAIAVGLRRLGRRRARAVPGPRVARRRRPRSPANARILMSPLARPSRGSRWAVPDLVRKDALLNPAVARRPAQRRLTPTPRSLAGPQAVSPLRASHGGLPPLLIQAASDDLLAPDAQLLAASASAEGADVTYTRWPRMWHDFALLPGLVAAADSALSQAAWFVTEGSPPSGPSARPSAASRARPSARPRARLQCGPGTQASPPDPRSLPGQPPGSLGLRVHLWPVHRSHLRRYRSHSRLPPHRPAPRTCPAP